MKLLRIPTEPTALGHRVLNALISTCVILYIFGKWMYNICGLDKAREMFKSKVTVSEMVTFAEVLQRQFSFFSISDDKVGEIRVTI